MSDFYNFMSAKEVTARRRAELQAAAAELKAALIHEGMTMLLSQHEPVAKLGIDRERLRVLFGFLHHHDQARLAREAAQVIEAQAANGGLP